MLKPAQLYKDELREKLIQSWYKPENIYYSGWTGCGIPDIPDNNYDSHHFVSVDKYREVIGYIDYRINWNAMSADRFGIISFDKGNIVFAKDLYATICNLFEMYHMNRISWMAYVDKVSEKIAELTGAECTLHECGIRSEKCKPCIAKNCLDIVHSGGIAPEKPQSKDGKYMQDREKFFGGADFLKKRFLEVK